MSASCWGGFGARGRRSASGAASSVGNFRSSMAAPRAGESVIELVLKAAIQLVDAEKGCS